MFGTFVLIAFAANMLWVVLCEPSFANDVFFSPFNEYIECVLLFVFDSVSSTAMNSDLRVEKQNENDKRQFIYVCVW